MKNISSSKNQTNRKVENTFLLRKGQNNKMTNKQINKINK